MTEIDCLPNRKHKISVRDKGVSIPSGDEALLWDSACSWVNENISKISGRAKKFLRYSPYAKRDFIQEAYIVAFSALRKSLRKGDRERFEQYFWVQLKHQYSKMATHPSRRKMLGSDASLSPCLFLEYADNGAKENPQDKLAETSNPLALLIDSEDVEERVSNNLSIQKALTLMSEKQRQVWMFLLGMHGEIPPVREIGRRIGVSRQRVEKLRDKGLKNVMKYFQNRP